MSNLRGTHDKSEDERSPISKLSSAQLGIVSGLVLLCYGVAGMTVGLVYLDSCPRHPLLSVWLVVMCVVAALLSLLLLALPACSLDSVTPAPCTPVTRPTLVLMFVSSLVCVLLVVTLVSWLSVGTFWLSHSRIRLEMEQEVRLGNV